MTMNDVIFSDDDFRQDDDDDVTKTEKVPKMKVSLDDRIFVGVTFGRQARSEIHKRMGN